jgi:ABC-type uncharacterized transport system auxiliary subunit
VLAALLPLFAAGCGRRTAQTFTLDYPTVVQKRASPAAPKVLWVDEFSAAGEYARQPFVYRTSEHRVHFDAVRRWAISPENMVRERVIRCLCESGLFARVVSQPGLKPPDLILRCHVLRIGEKLDNKARFAELSLHFELLEAAGETPLWTAILSRTRPVESARFDSVIEALSAALKEVLEDAVKQIQAKLAEQ